MLGRFDVTFGPVLALIVGDVLCTEWFIGIYSRIQCTEPQHMTHITVSSS